MISEAKALKSIPPHLPTNSIHSIAMVTTVQLVKFKHAPLSQGAVLLDQ